MKISTHNTELSQGASIYIPTPNGEVSITVLRNKRMRDKEWSQSTVNWPALGAVDVKTARDFANGLNLAHAIANNLNHNILPQSSEF